MLQVEKKFTLSHLTGTYTQGGCHLVPLITICIQTERWLQAGRESTEILITLEMMESVEQAGRRLTERNTGLMQKQGKC